MSDALTDIARDERRATKYHRYTEALLDHLEGKATVEQVVDAAKMTDDVPSGYWGDKTDLERDITGRLERLRDGDEGEWSKLLDLLSQQPSWRIDLYYRAKAISPWPDRLLIHVDYGLGFATTRCPDLHRIIAGAEMRTHDCDDYMVAIEVSDDDPLVMWTGCGIVGYDGPRRSLCYVHPPWRTSGDAEMLVEEDEE
jgi:hypothetical protein